MSELNEAIKLLDAHCSNRGVDVWNAAATAIAVLRTQAAELERCREALATLSIRVLQSDLTLDEREQAARDMGVALHVEEALKGATQ